jgi:hypothetical protein
MLVGTSQHAAKIGMDRRDAAGAWVEVEWSGVASRSTTTVVLRNRLRGALLWLERIADCGQWLVGVSEVLVRAGEQCSSEDGCGARLGWSWTVCCNARITKNGNVLPHVRRWSFSLAPPTRRVGTQPQQIRLRPRKKPSRRRIEVLYMVSLLLVAKMLIG